MNEDRLKNALSRIMLFGVLLSAAVMLVGGALLLVQSHGRVPGDHLFHGEPLDLRDPVDIFRAALAGADAPLVQLGVLLLLANPLVRVAFSVAGFAAGGDRLYAGISLIVLAVLALSYFI